MLNLKAKRFYKKLQNEMNHSRLSKKNTVTKKIESKKYTVNYIVSKDNQERNQDPTNIIHRPGQNIGSLRFELKDNFVKVDFIKNVDIPNIENRETFSVDSKKTFDEFLDFFWKL